MIPLTAGPLDRAARCVGPFVLPTEGRHLPWYDAGTDFHRFAELVLRGRVVAAEEFRLTLPPAEWARAGGWIDHGLPALWEWMRMRQKHRAEHSYAIRIDDGAVLDLGQDVGRDYLAAVERRGCELVLPAIFLTTDVVADSELAIWLLDWKTGTEAQQPHPRRGRQLLAGAYAKAYCQAQDLGCQLSEITGHIAYGFVDEDGAVTIRDAMIDGSEWAGIWADLQRLAQKVLAARAKYLETGEVEVVAGDHCGGCAAALSCPHTRRAAAALVPAQGQISKELAAELVTELTPAGVAQALGQWRHLKKIGEIIEERARLLAGDGGLPGWQLREVADPQYHGGIAYRVLAEQYSAELAKGAVRIEFSKTALEDAVRAQIRAGALPRGSLGKTVAAAMTAIEEAGGVDAGSYLKLEPVRR